MASTLFKAGAFAVAFTAAAYCMYGRSENSSEAVEACIGTGEKIVSSPYLSGPHWTVEPVVTCFTQTGQRIHIEPNDYGNPPTVRRDKFIPFPQPLPNG